MEIFALQVRYSDVLFEAMKRVQPEPTRSELNDVPFDEIAQAVARAIELCAPPSAISTRTRWKNRTKCRHRHNSLCLELTPRSTLRDGSNSCEPRRRLMAEDVSQRGRYSIARGKSESPVWVRRWREDVISKMDP